MRIEVGPTGQVIRGHVLDVSQKPFLQALKDYDAQLYFKWNPNKLKGWGCWEIRRAPEESRVKEVLVWEGNTIVCLDRVEQNLVHHVLDAPYLNYRVLSKLKEMDQWTDDSRGLDFNARAEYAEAKFLEKEEERAEAEKQYAIKQHRSQFRDLKEFVASGGNPYRLADHWGK